MSRPVVNANGPDIRKPPISDYTLLRCIGRGSYGDVWLGSTATGGYRAIKIIYRDRFADARPFERELEGLRAFDLVSRKDEGLVHVLHVSPITDGYFYYVMELADNTVAGQDFDPETYQPKTLEYVLRARARLPFKEALELSITLSKALSSLHKRGLVHRDVKPSNIIYVDGAPKLADIGMVTQMRDLTSYVGTEGFMPPEGPGTPQADVFSLGKVFYEACMGEDRKDFPKLPNDIDQWPEAAQVHELNEVLLKACDNDWRRRHQSAQELYADLVCLLNGESIKRLRVLERRLGKAKRLAIAAGLALLILGPLGFELLRENSRRNQDRARAIGSFLSEGIQRINAGEMISALTPLVQALSLDSNAKEKLNRTRIAAVLDQSPKLTHFLFNTNETTDGSFSSDGSQVVIATRNGKVHVRDAQTGLQLAPHFGPSQQVETASFSPDGQLVLIASQNGTATVWEWKTGRQLVRCSHPTFVFTAHFDHTGSRFVTSCVDKIARIWNATTGALELKIQHHQGVVSFAAFSPNDEFIVTTGHDNTARVSRASDGFQAGPVLPHRQWVTHACFSPDGRLLVTASVDKQAHVWDWREGREIIPPLEHADGVSSAEFSPDGAFILTTSWDMTARLWCAISGKPCTPNPVLPHSGRVLRGAFAPDGHRIMTSCYDGTSRIWDLAGSMVVPTVIHGQPCETGKRILLATNNTLQVLDVQQQKRFSAITNSNALIESALNNNGEYLVGLFESAQGQRQLSIFRSETSELFCAFPSFTNRLANVRLSDNGRWLASWSGKQLQLYDLPSRAEVFSLPVQKETIANAFFSPGSDHLAILSGHTALLLDLRNSYSVLPLKHSVAVKWASFSRDSRYVVTACSDALFTECVAQAWDATSGQPFGVPIRHKDGVLYASLSPSQRYFVSASEDFTAFVQRFDGRGLGKPLLHKHQVRKISFSEDETLLLTIDRDQFARVWETDSGDPVTPLLPHAAEPSGGSFLGNSSLVTNDRRGICRIWPLRAETLSLEELTTMARVLNGDIFDPKKRRVEACSEIIRQWDAVKQRHPERFAVSARQQDEWHRLQLYHAELDKQTGAAEFHRRHIEGESREPLTRTERIE